MKVTLTCLVSSKMKTQLQQAMLAEGYKLNAQSRWAYEAIDAFIKAPNFLELCKTSTQNSDSDVVEQDALKQRLMVNIPVEFKSNFDQAVLRVRKHLPIIEGVRSKIVRLAVSQRLSKNLVI